MIKILHVGLSSNAGGIENVVHSWAVYLPDDIHFDFVNVENKPLAFEEDFKKQGSQIYKIPSRRHDPAGSYKALQEIVRDGQYDYVHFHAMSLSWPEPVLAASAAPGTQAIVHSHMVVDKNMSRKYRMLHKIGAARLAGKDFYCLACGTDAGRTMFGKREFTVIENGIDLKTHGFTAEDRDRIRKELGITPEQKLIGHVGRSGAQKNYPFLIDSFARLHKQHPETRLLLLGNVDKDPEVQGHIRRHKLENAVYCPGYVSSTSPYYSAMDVFFFPSIYEGLSVALIEAQAAGLPCVVSTNIAEEPFPGILQPSADGSAERMLRGC